MTSSPPDPHDADAERAVLGSLLINGEVTALVEPLLRPGDFFRPHHGWIYEACLAVAARAEPVNEIMVAHELSVQGRLTEQSGLAYLSELTLATPSSAHAEHYARIVANLALQRAIIQTGGQIAALGYDAPGGSGEAALNQAETLLLRLRQNRTAGFTHIRDVLDQVVRFPGSGIEQRGAAASDLKRLPTGYPALDSLLGGFYRGNLVTVAARPGMGKTSLLMGFVRHIAQHPGARAVIFSLEMSTLELTERLVAAEAGVEAQRLRVGHLTLAEQERLWPAVARLVALDILFYDAAVLTPTEMRARLRQLHRQGPIDLVLVDYLQLMTTGQQRQNRVEQVGEITRSLKALARELEVPVIAASQLNREVEHRSPPVPQLSDLRESGTIEQDSDVVMFIYREDMYATPEEWDQQHPSKPYPAGIARIIVAKHRNGPTGERELFFRESLAKFETLVWEG